MYVGVVGLSEARKMSDNLTTSSEVVWLSEGAGGRWPPPPLSSYPPYNLHFQARKIQAPQAPKNDREAPQAQKMEKDAAGPL